MTKKPRMNVAVLEFVQEVSESMGFDGEINDKVIEEAKQRMGPALDRVMEKTKTRITAIDAVDHLASVLEECDDVAFGFAVRKLIGNDVLDEIMVECDGDILAELYEELIVGARNVEYMKVGTAEHLLYNRMNVAIENLKHEKSYVVYRKGSVVGTFAYFHIGGSGSHISEQCFAFFEDDSTIRFFANSSTGYHTKKYNGPHQNFIFVPAD